ncbi:MAG TPA: iron-containing redox enzyme family protein [Solirubrobacterales bacterium]
MTDRIWERIDQARQRHDVLQHPFYQRWSEGELTTEELARYAGQYRHAVEAIAKMTDAAASALPDRDDLRTHAAEERGHVRLWDGFVEAVGGDTNAEPTPQTAECVATWTRDGDVLETLARLYAVEFAQPEISKIKREGLLDRYGFEDGSGTAYFKVHSTRDVEHAAEVRELIAELAQEGDEDRIVAAAESAYQANWRLLDGV